MSVTVAVSTVADGSMHNRHDPLDPIVTNNRRMFLEKNGMSIATATRFNIDYNRTNYCQYTTIDAAAYGHGMSDNNAIMADALITTTPGQTLFLPVADCIGAVIYDPHNEVVMLVHLGRHSLEQQGGVVAVQHLVDAYKSAPRELQVWLTPAPGKGSYPIWKLDNKGMKEATLEQLQTAGILLDNIHDNPADTTKDAQYFSYSAFLKNEKSQDGDHSIAVILNG